MVSKQAGVAIPGNMLFVEAAVPDADVDETSGAEKDDLAILIDDRTVTGISPHHSSFPSDATTRHPFAPCSDSPSVWPGFTLVCGPSRHRFDVEFW
jgi:hypothetical protein